MILKFKNYQLIRDQYNWEIVEVKEYEKLDSLRGSKTGEIGKKEISIGYYPITRFDLVMERLIECLIDENISTIEDYLNQYKLLKEELMNHKFLENGN